MSAPQPEHELHQRYPVHVGTTMAATVSAATLAAATLAATAITSAVAATISAATISAATISAATLAASLTSAAIAATAITTTAIAFTAIPVAAAAIPVAAAAIPVAAAAVAAAAVAVAAIPIAVTAIPVAAAAIPVAAAAVAGATPVVDGYAHDCHLRGRDVLRDGSYYHLDDKHVPYGRWRNLHASRCAARWSFRGYRGCEDSSHMQRSARHDRVHDGWLQLGLQQLHGRRQRTCIPLARKRLWGKQFWCLRRRIRFNFGRHDQNAVRY